MVWFIEEPDIVTVLQGPPKILIVITEVLDSEYIAMDYYLEHSLMFFAHIITRAGESTIERTFSRTYF